MTSQKLTPDEAHKINQRLQRAAQEERMRKSQAEAAAWNDGRDTDRARGVGHHDVRSANVNFDQKIYWLPPHFLELRKELEENWHMTVWPRVAYYMAHKAEEFIEVMNEVTGLRLVLDTDKVDYTCEQYLKKLRQMRGAA